MADGRHVILAAAWILTWVGAAGAAQPGRTPAPDGGSPGSPVEATGAQLWGTVRSVHEGARLVIETPELGRLEVRLLGVDLPEPPRQGREGVPLTAGQPFGPEAMMYLADLLVDKQVRFETYGKDRSGRLLAVVWLGSINVNLTLVKEGLAWVRPSIAVARVRVELEVAEKQARVGRYGLWALPDPIAPWEFRRRHRLPVE